MVVSMILAPIARGVENRQLWKSLPRSSFPGSRLGTHRVRGSRLFDAPTGQWVIPLVPWMKRQEPHVQSVPREDPGNKSESLSRSQAPAWEQVPSRVERLPVTRLDSRLHGNDELRY